MGLRHLYRIAALLIAGLAVAGCVAPQYTYVADSSDNAYFKVPPSWRQVSQSSLEQAQGPSSQDGAYLWSRAYEDNAKPSVQHVFAATPQPVAYASVLQLSAAERNDMSFNSMRDLLLPVTANARKAASASARRACPASRCSVTRWSRTATTIAVFARYSTTTSAPRQKPST